MLEDESIAAQSAGVQKLVTADGTYATQSAFSAGTDVDKKKGEERPPLRKYLMEGDFFIGASLGTTLTKLALRYCQLVQDIKKQNRYIILYLTHSRMFLLMMKLGSRPSACWF